MRSAAQILLGMVIGAALWAALCHGPKPDAEAALKQRVRLDAIEDCMHRNTAASFKECEILTWREF